MLKKSDFMKYTKTLRILHGSLNLANAPKYVDFDAK